MELSILALMGALNAGLFVYGVYIVRKQKAMTESARRQIEHARGVVGSVKDKLVTTRAFNESDPQFMARIIEISKSPELHFAIAMLREHTFSAIQNPPPGSRSSDNMAERAIGMLIGLDLLPNYFKDIARKAESMKRVNNEES